VTVLTVTLPGHRALMHNARLIRYDGRA